MFLGTVAAGVPLLITSDVAGQAHNHTSAAGDRVFEHLAREIAEIHNRVQRRGPRGEDARALAAALRTMKVYGGQVDFDGKVKKGLRSLSNKHGREQFLYVEPDKRRVRDELRRFGAEVQESAERRTPVPDYATRAKVLDEMLARGVSPGLDRLARAFDEAAEVLDRTNVAQIRRVQTLDCWQWSYSIAMLEVEAGYMCALAVIVPAAATACAMLMGSLATYQLFYWMYCR
jgi:hypothetical protein